MQWYLALLYWAGGEDVNRTCSVRARRSSHSKSIFSSFAIYKSSVIVWYSKKIRPGCDTSQIEFIILSINVRNNLTIDLAVLSRSCTHCVRSGIAARCRCRYVHYAAGPGHDVAVIEVKIYLWNQGGQTTHRNSRVSDILHVARITRYYHFFKITADMGMTTDESIHGNIYFYP